MSKGWPWGAIHLPKLSRFLELFLLKTHFPSPQDLMASEDEAAVLPVWQERKNQTTESFQLLFCNGICFKIRTSLLEIMRNMLGYIIKSLPQKEHFFSAGKVWAAELSVNNRSLKSQ